MLSSLFFGKRDQWVGRCAVIGAERAAPLGLGSLLSPVRRLTLIAACTSGSDQVQREPTFPLLSAASASLIIIQDPDALRGPRCTSSATRNIGEMLAIAGLPASTATRYARGAPAAPM